MATLLIAAGAGKDAADNLSRLATPSSMVSGRMICPVSANGAPDCKLGADKRCQTKAFKEGESLTTDSAETCAAKVLIPRRARKPGDCRTDNYVTRALPVAPPPWRGCLIGMMSGILRPLRHAFALK